MNDILARLDLALGDYIVAITFLLCGLLMMVAIWGFAKSLEAPLWKR